MKARILLRSVLGLMILSASFCFAQFTSNVQGTVQDPSGAVVAKATVTLVNDALDQTGCKERGVQKMSFNCSFNVANGTQTLLILPDIAFSGNKKASVEVNTVKCVDHCELLPPPPNP